MLATQGDVAQRESGQLLRSFFLACVREYFSYLVAIACPAHIPASALQS